MATTTIERSGGAHAKQSGSGVARGDRVGLGGAIQSEFTKIRSVRSTYWTLLAMIVVCVGMGALFSAGHAAQVGWFGQADIDKWIPFNAGGAIWEHVSGVNQFSPWIGFAVFCSYAAAAMVAGLVLFIRRDA